MISQGWTALGHRLREWAKLAGKAVIAVSLLMGLIPLLFGLLLELVVLTPVRVPLHQSPIYFLWQVITVLISRLKGYPLIYPARARALRALGLLLADGALTVGWGKTFWGIGRVPSRKRA